MCFINIFIPWTFKLFMKKVGIWMISIFALLIIATIILIIYKGIVAPNYPVNNLIRVIDGDTFELSSEGQVIRLLCVDTPEEGDEWYEEAKDFLDNLLFEKTITLKSSDYSNDTDAYGRLLRWVYIEDETGEQILINKLIIDEGYGELMIIPPETCQEITEIVVD